MVARRRSVRASASRRGRDNAVPEFLQEMLDEAGVGAGTEEPERPLKRRRRNDRTAVGKASEKAPPETDKVQEADGHDEGDDGDDEDIAFEDVPLPPATVQTMELDSDEDSDDEDGGVAFDDFLFTSPLKESSIPTTQGPQDLELNLTAEKAASTPSKRSAERRKALSKEDRDRRACVHQAHLVCLLAHVSRRNRWCNDGQVQDTLRSHLTEKMVRYLNPGTNLSQFGRTESLKTGVQQAGSMWKTKFDITESGLRRALWAEDPEDLEGYEPPGDMDSVLDRDAFREAAKSLEGSRDVGAQLYCALLRAAGVEARLVCSLQPLACTSNAPVLPKSKPGKTPTKQSKAEQSRAALEKYRASMNGAHGSPSTKPSARRRLGHPNATAHNFEPVASPPKPRSSTFEAPKRIKESSYPVYWVEVLDVGHQKWQPVDAVVTHTFWKPRSLEPPITDRENAMSYAVAFSADGTAKDVTRRYAKAYTAKTRRIRIETAVEGGDKWWRKAMRPYRRMVPTDLDQIEENELTGIEAREPMPRNVQDFKDHPVYALERHLRRAEVLVPDAMPSGTISAGNKGALEKIYRRRDVRIARSADKWYRLGREVKPNEIPAKWLPKKARPRNGRFADDGEDDERDDAGTPIYTQDQTEQYEPPPVRNGRIPKNKFGNIDVYVPSMVPRGGVHIMGEHAAKAAFLVGVDYAPALTGFDFKGRHGTAVLNGVVVAKEAEEAVRAAIDAMGDLEREAEDERRRALAIRMWRRMLMGLRIRERVWAGVDEEERREADRVAIMEAEIQDAESDVSEEIDMVVDDEDDYGGGGFIVE
ncbi:hypothetical protein NLU13_9766 [Sarocladium strictum]|uniref:Uncharacterized protein n=1 Tax=Sarocladium strictum TaxID=5046 RepID=A0AA39L4P1_SARSR|nr:hypothetical protein NLU13_9766 [Sarocladium strictum]